MKNNQYLFFLTNEPTNRNPITPSVLMSVTTSGHCTYRKNKYSVDQESDQEKNEKKTDNGQEKKKVIMLSTKKKRKFFFLGRFLGRDHVFFLFFLLSCFLL